MMSWIKQKTEALRGLFWKNQKISFSQCGEDLIIKFICDSIGIEQPTYIDIGAHHPSYLSNTALFYKSGSRGVNIEPDPSLITAFYEERKEDINLNVGVGEKVGVNDFYIMNIPTLNTFSKEESEKYQKEDGYYINSVKKIETVTVQDIIDDHVNGVFPDLLSLDAEGIDELVLGSIDYEKCFPKIICVETLSFSATRKNAVKNVKMISTLKEKGYMLYADTYINSIFVLKNLWFC